MVATLGGEHAELLSQVELFRGLDRVTLAKLVAHLEPLSLSAGDVLFRQGDPRTGCTWSAEERSPSMLPPPKALTTRSPSVRAGAANRLAKSRS